MTYNNTRAQEFHQIVAPYLRQLGSYTLVECCAGDGKGALQFTNEPNLEKIVFVDIKEVTKFKKNADQLTKPFELYCNGLDELVLPSDVAVIGIHACGILTDKILEKAVAHRAPVAVMPCCYNRKMEKYKLDFPPAGRFLFTSNKDYYDAFRLQYLKENGYRAGIKTINKKITPMNNVIIGLPDSNNNQILIP